MAILSALRYVRALPLFASSAICVFEHGGCSDATNSCINHFHLHLINNNLDLTSELSSEYEVRRAEVSPNDTLTVAGSYLFVGRFNGHDSIHGFVAPCLQREAQYFRKKIAELTGQPIWDWRADINREMMLRTMNSIRI